MRLVLSLGIAALTLGGCVAQQNSLYKWGGYESLLYGSYKDPTQTENLRVKLETHIAEMEKSGQKIAPGLYAELGTLYLQLGDSNKAAAYYARERDAWPESKGLMDAMLQNLNRRQQAKMEIGK